MSKEGAFCSPSHYLVPVVRNFFFQFGLKRDLADGRGSKSERRMENKAPKRSHAIQLRNHLRAEIANAIYVQNPIEPSWTLALGRSQTVSLFPISLR